LRFRHIRGTDCGAVSAGSTWLETSLREGPPMADEEFVYRGNLEETTLPEILATIHRHGVPGVMEFARDGDETKKVFFLDGDVIFATSSERTESLGDYLLSQGKITKAQYRVSCDELTRSPGRRHGTILVQMGFLKSEELGVAVREQVQAILWNLFNWMEGQVAFRVGRFRDDEIYKIKIPTPRVVLSGCKRINDAKMVTGRLGVRRTVFSRPARPEHLASLKLETGEQELLELVNGKRTLVELCESGPLSPGINARVLYAFLVLQLVERDRASATAIKIQVRTTDEAPPG